MTAKVWDEGRLTQMRLKGDDLADRVIKDLLDAGGDEAVQRLLGQIVSVPEGIPPDMPAEVRDYFLDDDRPAWVDMALVKAGEDFFERHGIEICSILICASLPACYAMAKGVRALDYSNQLTRHPERRLIETSRLVLGVLAPGSLTGDNRGALIAKKVRMLHATMRHIMRTHLQTKLDHPVVWDEAAWGAPLNQEDLALTLMTFSTVVLDSLDKLGMALKPAHEAAYFHCWRYVGYLMGVDPELNPETVEDGRSLTATIARLEYGRSEAGVRLTSDLITFVENLLPEIFRGIVPSKIRFLVGNQVADILDVPPADWTVELLEFGRALHLLEGEISGHSQWMTPLTNMLGRELLNTMESFVRTDGRPMFHVPDILRDKWKLPPSAVRTPPPTPVPPTS